MDYWDRLTALEKRVANLEHPDKQDTHNITNGDNWAQEWLFSPEASESCPHLLHRSNCPPCTFQAGLRRSAAEFITWINLEEPAIAKVLSGRALEARLAGELNSSSNS